MLSILYRLNTSGSLAKPTRRRAHPFRVGVTRPAQPTATSERFRTERLRSERLRPNRAARALPSRGQHVTAAYDRHVGPITSPRLTVYTLRARTHHTNRPNPRRRVLAHHDDCAVHTVAPCKRLRRTRAHIAPRSRRVRAWLVRGPHDAGLPAAARSAGMARLTGVPRRHLRRRETSRNGRC